MTYELPKLDYGYDAFSPTIDEETMRLHHKAHHKAYVEKFNAALEKAPEFQDNPIESLLANPERLPATVRDDIRNHGGGHYNHSFFWKILSPQKTAPGKEISKAIDNAFSSFDNFAQEFTKVASSHFGSGYAWLSVANSGALTIHSLPNQDTPLLQGLRPIFLLDLWEHAYYLTYRNRRNEFIRAFWNVVNWPVVEENYLKALRNNSSEKTPPAEIQP